MTLCFVVMMILKVALGRRAMTTFQTIGVQKTVNTALRGRRERLLPCLRMKTLATMRHPALCVTAKNPAYVDCRQTWMCNFEHPSNRDRGDGTCVDCARRITNNQCLETHDANTSECMEECLQDSISTDRSRIYQPVSNPNFEYNLEYNSSTVSGDVVE